MYIHVHLVLGMYLYQEHVLEESVCLYTWCWYPGVQWIADTVSVLCAGQCKKVLGNVRRCWAMYEGPGHCMKVLGTVRRCWALYEGARQCKKVLGTVRRC